MPILHQSRIFQNDLAANPTVLYVFGDNLERWGFGGQAKEMRGYKNAVGLPTKRSPRQYLYDSDLPDVIAAATPDLVRLARHLLANGIVIWPLDGIGTGLALLAKLAPAVDNWYAMEKYKLQIIVPTKRGA